MPPTIILQSHQHTFVRLHATVLKQKASVKVWQHSLGFRRWQNADERKKYMVKERKSTMFKTSSGTVQKRHLYRMFGPRRISRLWWFLSLFVLVSFFFFFYRELIFFQTFKGNLRESTKESWLINTSMCQIPDYGIFPHEFTPYWKSYPELNCSEETPRYIYTSGNTFIMDDDKIDDSWGFECKAYEIERLAWLDSYTSKLEERQVLEGWSMAQHEFVGVLCLNEITFQKVFHDFFGFINLKDEVEKRCSKLRNKLGPNPLSVLLLGVRSLSHASFLRNFRKTKEFLKRSDINFVEFNGYQKTAHGTVANLISILAGNNEELDDEYDAEDYLDEQPFVWKNFAENGYRTLMAEDSGIYGAFNYLYSGFKKQPTDYYLRPLVSAAEHWASMTKRRLDCLNQRKQVDLVLDWTAEFFNKFPLAPKFAFTYLSRLTRDDTNRASQYDIPVANFLEQLYEQDNLKNTVVIMFSEEGGAKMSNYRTTTAGIIEDRTPFLGMILPPEFQFHHKDLYQNLLNNQNRLVSTFDIHKTILHLINLEKTDFVGYGESLFKEIPEDRTCDMAWIPEALCNCVDSQRPIEESDHSVLSKAVDTFISTVNALTEDMREYCESFTLVRVLNTWKRVHDDTTIAYGLVLLASPSKSVLEGYVLVNNVTGYMTADTVLDNVNFNSSPCLMTVNPQVKKFCPCFETDNYALK